MKVALTPGIVVTLSLAQRSLQFTLAGDSKLSWDSNSLMIRGERVMILSGEFHPFRLPVPDLWLDIFEKIKAMGFTGVSFYVDWALLEGSPGTIVKDGIFALDKFFAAAKKAGIYLIARPGPFINAEVSGGGFPGWIQRLSGRLRTSSQDFIDATSLYTRTIGEIIANAQMPDGPVILFQPENEFSGAVGDAAFPNATNSDYMGTVEEQFRDVGVVVPFVDNDNRDGGSFRAGAGNGSVDIYGIDDYPLGFSCANPDNWPESGFQRSLGYRESHLKWSPSTPFSVLEFQGGSFDPWGGSGEDACAALVNHEAARVLYKNLYSIGARIINLYMTYGGTNWGNLGHPGGYTSYDYGAAITEDRQVVREKYSEQKLQANFFKSVPAYLSAVPGVSRNGTLGTPADINVTPLRSNGSGPNFYVVRHADFRSKAVTRYRIQVLTSSGNITVPQLTGQLVLNGRDAKIHTTNLAVGSVSLLYTTAEVFSIVKTESGPVLLLYAGPNETHEFALSRRVGTPTIYGSNVTTQVRGSNLVVNWKSLPQRRVLRFGSSLTVYLLDRNEAYGIWPVELPAPAPIGNFYSPSKSQVVVKAGYLIRSAYLDGSSLHIRGDVNASASLELIAAPVIVDNIYFNGREMFLEETSYGTLLGTLDFVPLNVSVPSLEGLEWKYIDSLPELNSTYDDISWPDASQTTTNNPRGLTTPVNLYAGDYGFHTGSLIYRGYFVANTPYLNFTVRTQGGSAYAHSIWLNDTFLGSWAGSPSEASHSQTVGRSSLVVGQTYILTILIDHMGNDENNAAGYDYTKHPRGILDYSLAGHDGTAIRWKLTGNIGGEDYFDKDRGPLNEGGLYAERQGLHQPLPRTTDWESRSPLQGISSAGVGFFTADFDLNIPQGWDVPLSFVFANGTRSAANSTSNPSTAPFPLRNSTQPAGNYRAVLYVNGYQFGKLISHLGPQTQFPVPEGILNHRGKNTVALMLWALDTKGARLDGLKLVPKAVVQSSFQHPGLSPAPVWAERFGAY
ncbi:glycoside hydrolase family 35 protein [Thozetella sp. PMI_491]|nr:glycoside hydrolase family 35 protein [Thozetella sp. PMI_491]